MKARSLLLLLALAAAVMRDGQTVTIYNSQWTFTGKRGTLTIREPSEWVDIAGDVERIHRRYDGFLTGRLR